LPEPGPAAEPSGAVSLAAGPTANCGSFFSFDGDVMVIPGLQWDRPTVKNLGLHKSNEPDWGRLHPPSHVLDWGRLHPPSHVLDWGRLHPPSHVLPDEVGVLFTGCNYDD
jgi:hypothetical protein